MQEKYKRLTDSQWQVIAEFLPVKRKRRLNLRDIVDAILWLDRIGSQWRNLPECFPSFWSQSRSFLQTTICHRLRSSEMALGQRADFRMVQLFPEIEQRLRTNSRKFRSLDPMGKLPNQYF